VGAARRRRRDVFPSRETINSRSRVSSRRCGDQWQSQELIAAVGELIGAMPVRTAWTEPRIRLRMGETRSGEAATKVAFRSAKSDSLQLEPQDEISAARNEG